MSPTPLAAALLAACAVLAVALGPGAGVLGALVLAGAVLADALAVRRAPHVARRLPPVLARGVPGALRVQTELAAPGRVRLRQPMPADLDLTPREADGELDATIVARRRGRHAVPDVSTRNEGPLRLGRWRHRRPGHEEVLVYPDLPAARRIATAVRQGRFRTPGPPARLTRGPLGLGTDFESIRDYSPDDDIRQVNWKATQRTGRPMSNQFRVEQDREVLLLVDSGRLMRAPLGDRTRLDAALDAAVAVAAVADAVGDRCGVLAFDDRIRRRIDPRRAGADAIVRAVFDLEPTTADTDYDLAFQAVEGRKRSLIVVFGDLVDEAAARPLAAAIPVLVRRHVVVVAASTDPQITARLTHAPERPAEVYAQTVALDVLAARERTRRALERAGAQVVEARPPDLGAQCVRTYLRAKARARL